MDRYFLRKASIDTTLAAADVSSPLSWGPTGLAAGAGLSRSAFGAAAGFAADAIAGLQHLLRDHRANAQHEMDPGLYAGHPTGFLKGFGRFLAGAGFADNVRHAGDGVVNQRQSELS